MNSVLDNHMRSSMINSVMRPSIGGENDMQIKIMLDGT